jgi:hypothetical protein
MTPEPTSPVHVLNRLTMALSHLIDVVSARDPTTSSLKNDRLRSNLFLRLLSAFLGKSCGRCSTAYGWSHRAGRDGALPIDPTRGAGSDTGLMVPHEVIPSGKGATQLAVTGLLGPRTE